MVMLFDYCIALSQFLHIPYKTETKIYTEIEKGVRLRPGESSGCGRGTKVNQNG